MKRFKNAVKIFVQADDQFKDIETYQTDKIDFLRQVWSDKGDDAYARLVSTINYQDKERIKNAGNAFIDMVKTQDELLGNNKFFTLNRWLEEATDFGKNLPDAKNVMYNAKGQITFWGPDNLPRTTLRDYAHKDWNGLLGSLYLERWKVFVDNSVNGKISNPEDFYKMEVEWSKKPDLYQPKKSTAEEFKKLQAKILE